MEMTIKELAKKVKITVKNGAILAWDKLDKWQQDANGYRITLSYCRRRMSLDFWQGLGITHDPTADGVLDCLLSEASGADESFEDWCGNFGYDPDSRKAEKMYKQVRVQTTRLKSLL